MLCRSGQAPVLRLADRFARRRACHLGRLRSATGVAISTGRTPQPNCHRQRTEGRPDPPEPGHSVCRSIALDDVAGSIIRPPPVRRCDPSPSDRTPLVAWPSPNNEDFGQALRPRRERSVPRSLPTVLRRSRAFARTALRCEVPSIGWAAWLRNSRPWRSARAKLARPANGPGTGAPDMAVHLLELLPRLGPGGDPIKPLEGRRGSSAHSSQRIPVSRSCLVFVATARRAPKILLTFLVTLVR